MYTVFYRSNFKFTKIHTMGAIVTEQQYSVKSAAYLHVSLLWAVGGAVIHSDDRNTKRLEQQSRSLLYSLCVRARWVCPDQHNTGWNVEILPPVCVMQRESVWVNTARERNLPGKADLRHLLHTVGSKPLINGLNVREGWLLKLYIHFTYSLPLGC